MLLADKVALVSGAGPGLGRAIALRFAAEGARVVVGDVDAAAVADTCTAIGAAGGAATGLPTDITDAAQCQALVDHALGHFGRLDVLVNDAYHGGDFQTFEDADLANWKATAEVNIWGTLTLTKAALPALKVSGDAHIVNICTHGVDLIQPGFGAYTGSKAALAHLTQMLAAELGTHGIRVNAVYPGPIWGANLQGYLDQQAAAAGVEPQAMYDEFAAKNSLNRLIRPEEIASAVAFLASDMATAITGQALYVNAGETFH